MMRPVLSESEYRALRGTDRQKLNRIQGNKTKLVQMNYSCRPDPHPLPSLRTPSIPRTAGAECLKGEGVITTAASGYGPLKGCTTPSDSVGMDVDFDPADPDYAQKMAAVPELVLGKKDELGLLMLERSVRKGYHIVFKRRAELSQEENLRWASDLLGVQYDEGAKDITRVFFTTTDSEEDLLFVDQKLFSSEELGPRSDKEGLISRQREDEPLGEGSKSEECSLVRSEAPNSSLESYDGIPYRNIVEALENQLGGVPAHGSRNQFIFSMACHLRYVCNDDPEWIAKVLPTYGEATEKWRGTIQSACKRSQNKTMPKVLLRAIDQARANSEVTTPSPLQEGQGEGSGLGLPLPPSMPKTLPPLIKLLVSKTPKIYQPAVAHAVFPALAAHLWHTRFKYIDNVEHEATLMNVLMAGTGAGKNCIAAPIDCILKDIRERDAVNLEKERQWKEEMQTKGANKDKKKRPEGIVI